MAGGGLERRAGLVLHLEQWAASGVGCVVLGRRAEESMEGTGRMQQWDPEGIARCHCGLQVEGLVPTDTGDHQMSHISPWASEGHKHLPFQPCVCLLGCPMEKVLRSGGQHFRVFLSHWVF